MEDRLKEVTLSGIFAVEKFQKLKHKFLIDDLFADARLEVGRLEETQKELVDESQMWPRSLQGRIVLFGIKVWIITRRQGPEQVACNLNNE